MKSRMLFLLGITGVIACLALSCAQTDPGLTAKVKAKLAADQSVQATQIDVTTHNGVVTLTGNVDSQAAKDRAMELARDTKGVVSVQDMISVKTAAEEGNAPEPDRTVGERIDDAAITIAVKAKLLEDPLVKGLKIDVDTREGVVYLTGTVGSQQEKDKAIELARGAKNVRDVQANLTVGKT